MDTALLSPPPSPTPRSAAARLARAGSLGGMAVVALLALASVAVHLASTGRFGYGFFVDELYFLACSEHLSWGFVDMPPLFPALTALVRAVCGDSLFAVRLVPTLASAGLVFLTGLMARDLGGRRFAQGLAALTVLTAPLWMALFSIHTMNALDQLVWAAGAWLVIRIVRDDWPAGWLWFGALCGIGLLNKHSVAFFGVAVAVGLLLTPERKALRSRWLWLGAAAALLLFLPNLIWMVEHHFPHFEMLRNIKADGRDVHLNPLQFMLQQVLMFNPLAAPLWLGGLGWFLFGREGRRWRILGIAYLALMAEMFLLDGRVYYPAPAYPMLLAGGAVALERWLAARPQPARIWRLAGPAYAALLLLSGALLAPLWMPLLPPETVIRYSQALGFSEPRIETHRLGPLPQLLADRFGWPEMAAEVARVYRSLPPADLAVLAEGGRANPWRPFINELTGALVAGLLFFPVRAFVRRFPLSPTTWLRRLPLYLLALVLCGATATTVMWGLRSLLYPLAGLGRYDYGVMPLRYFMELPLQVIWFTLLVGALHAFAALDAARARALRAAQLEGSLARAQVRNLRLQLQPHFLFNALNTISATMYDDPQAADEMLDQLAELLRASLSTARSDEVPLALELDLLNRYLALLRARFGDRLAVTLEIEPGTEGALVPSLLLQPLVENAVRHGGGVEHREHRRRGTLRDLEERLDPARFLRLNRSEIVRLDAIREVQPWFHGDARVVLADGSVRTWSRRYRTKVDGLF